MPTLDELTEKMEKQAALHTEKAFIIGSLLLVFGLLVLRLLLGSMFLVVVSFAFFNYLVYLWKNTDAGIWGILREQISIIPAPQLSTRERRRETAWATWGLIGANAFIYLFIQSDGNQQFIQNNLEFIPAEPNLFNVPFSMLSCLYLHAGFMHLYGNMCFLWATGRVVERRIGWRRFLVYYHAAGVAGVVLCYLVYVLSMEEELHLVGASGAIAGVMGIFIVRCYFKKMTFPLPAFGVLPFNFNLQMNGLVVIGLFFTLDLNGGLRQLLGLSNSSTAYWAHLGGIMVGAGLAWRANLGESAVEERHRDIGNAVFDGADVVAKEFAAVGGFDGARKSLHIALEKDPCNPETLLALARIESYTVRKPEGKEYYQRAITILLETSPQEAVEAFREYFPRYRSKMAPGIQYRIASQLHKGGYLELAERALMQLADSADTPGEIREQSLFYSARILEQLGLPEPARRYYTRFAEEHPNSSRIESVQSRLARLLPAQDAGNDGAWSGVHGG